MNQLEKYRGSINKIDEEIIQLLEKRLKISSKIGRYKKKNNLNVTDKKREKQIFNKIKKQSKKLRIKERYLKEVFKTIIKNSKENQNNIK